MVDPPAGFDYVSEVMYWFCIFKEVDNYKSTSSQNQKNTHTHTHTHTAKQLYGVESTLNELIC